MVEADNLEVIRTLNDGDIDLTGVYILKTEIIILAELKNVWASIMLDDRPTNLHMTMVQRALAIEEEEGWRRAFPVPLERLAPISLILLCYKKKKIDALN